MGVATKALFTWTTVVSLACTPTNDVDPKVQEAFDRLLHALETADGEVLWNLCDEETRRYFDRLADRIRRDKALVQSCYPSAFKSRALSAILGHYVSDRTKGRELFLALLDPRRFEAPDDEARTVARVESRGRVLRVITGSGRSIDFVREGGGLRTTRLREVFEDMPWVETLMGNLRAVEDSCKGSRTRAGSEG